MKEHTINLFADAGIVTSLIAGHTWEMAGAAMQTVPCPFVKAAGAITEAAGRTVADKGVEVGTRDRKRLQGKHHG